jgi:ribonuclease R
MEMKNMRKKGQAMREKRQGDRPNTTIRGTIMTTGKGLGFVNDERAPLPDDVMIEAGFLNTALNGDTVEVALHPLVRGERQTGEVTRVISRAKKNFVGIVELSHNTAFITPDDRRMYTSIVIPTLTGAPRLENGMKVQVKITQWTDPKRNPEGQIVRVLGKKGDHNVEMESIVLEKGFDTRFPAEVEKEADEIGKNKAQWFNDDIHIRKDFRDTLTFTIDPFDAKDFDDAISFKKLGGGKYEIGVHIADVSHYVREGSALDREAFHRGCSIYLVDRTIPMLPEVLSNDVCSLNPNEDKLTFSSVFVMDDHGRVHERWFGRTIINSNKRFTYEDAQKCIDEKAGPYAEELIILNTIAKVLQKEKKHKGAIEFDTEEIKFKLDENNKPIGVYRKERLDTHKLVEEYMLLSNKEVAKFIYESLEKKGHHGTGSIYRIHDAPDPDRISDLGIFVRALGHHFPKDKITSRDINVMLASIEGTPEADLIRTATVRSMAKAIYSTKNIGHFGLAFEYYTHFTSPIRRYPDLLVHRILANHLYHQKFSDREIVTFGKIAEQSSEREIAAAEAERASKKYKQVEYMSERVGNVYDGIISGIAEWGIYIEEIETKSEGMIKISELGDDYFEIDKKTYSVIGQRSKKKFRLGDKVRFKVIAADLEKKMLDYKLVN